MLNHIVVMGRLGRDPELRRTQNGTPVASFVLAVDRDYKDKTTGERATDWINIVAWRGTAEFVTRYFSKGRMAVVEGRLQVRNWTDKNEMQRTTAEVVAENVYFGDSPRREGDNGGGSGAYGAPQGGYGAPQGGYGAPQGGSYGAPPQSSYGAPQGGSYGAPPQSGYSAPSGGNYGGSSYGAPPADGDAFSELADDDGELPF